MGKWTVTICLFFYELFTLMPSYLLLGATEDIVAGTLIQSSLILTLHGIGSLLAKIAGPILVKWLNLSKCIILSIVLFIATWIIFVVGHPANIRLVGAFTNGILSGLATVIGFYLLSFYGDTERNSSAFIAGYNAAAFVVGIIYTGSTVWLCFPPRLTFAIVFPLVMLIVPIYMVLNHGPLKTYQIKDDIHYKKLDLPEEDHNKLNQPRLYDNLSFFFKFLPSVNHFFLSTILNRFVSNSVITSLTFHNAPFRVRDHFQYYTFLIDIGRILGSTETFLISFFCPSWMNCLQFRHAWIVVLLSFGHLLFFLLATWYRFVSNVFFVLILCITEGMVTSALFIRGLYLIDKKFTTSSERGLAYTISEAGSTVGYICAGLIGVYVEESLRQNCTYELLLGKYCLARFTSTLGWTINWRCR